MGIEKREILLIAGVLFLMVGTMPFLAPIYSILIAAASYLGVKVIVKKRNQHLKKIIGEGFCAICGSKVVQNKCPNCDNMKDG